MPLHPDYLRVVPDLHTPEYDNEEYRETHYHLFGHYPPLNPEDKCRHPLHDTIRRNMNGATFDIPFADTEIVSDDSEYHARLEERRKVVFKSTQTLQDEIEERQAYERAKGMGLILPNRPQ